MHQIIIIKKHECDVAAQMHILKVKLHFKFYFNINIYTRLKQENEILKVYYNNEINNDI